VTSPEANEAVAYAQLALTSSDAFTVRFDCEGVKAFLSDASLIATQVGSLQTVEQPVAD
jgi:hypothetical protein